MKTVGGLLLAFFGLATADKLLVLPLRVDSLSEQDSHTLQDMFVDQLQLYTQSDVVRGPDTAQSCYEKACAISLAGEKGAARVVFGSVRRLGRQMYFSASISKANGEEFFQQRLGVAAVEDFEKATARMAESLIKRQNLDQVASVENITASEEEQAANVSRRKGFYSTGVTLGFLWPVDGAYSRYITEDDPSCSSQFDCPQVEREQRNSQVFKLGWNNWFEFKPQLAMEMDLFLFAPIALAADANLLYFFNRSDFSPFAGGGLGIQYVFPDQGTFEDPDKRNAGPAGNVQLGMIFFRTYNINMVVRGQYHFVGNSDFDNGPSIDVGVRTKIGSTGGDKYHRTSATTWLGVGLGIAYVVALILAGSSGG